MRRPLSCVTVECPISQPNAVTSFGDAGGDGGSPSPAYRRPPEGSPRRAPPRPHAARLRASRPDRRVLGLAGEPRLRGAPDRLRGGPDAPSGARWDAAGNRAGTLKRTGNRAAGRVVSMSDRCKLPVRRSPQHASLPVRSRRREDAPVDRPVTRYATTEDDVHIAYQVFGHGPIDVVFVHAFVSHVELFWELPSYARFIRELSSWGRAIMFDKRGVGLSDRLSVIPTIEARLDDLRAVLDAVGSERTLVVGNNDGGALAALFAATYPERTLGLVLWRGGVRTARAPDYPWGVSEDRFEERLARRMVIWGDESAGEEAARMTFPGIGERLAKDPAFVRWLTRLQRYAAAPGDQARFSRAWFTTDARSVLPLIQVPAAVVMRTGWIDAYVQEARWTADQIPGAQLVAVPGDGDDVYLGDVGEVAEAIRGFAQSIEEEHAAFDRVLATVLFTDIVGSSERAAQLGDQAWKRLIEQHHARVR